MRCVFLPPTLATRPPPLGAALRQAIAKGIVAYFQKFVDEASKKELKDILLTYDRTLLVADPRRCEPKKCAPLVARLFSTVLFAALLSASWAKGALQLRCALVRRRDALLFFLSGLRCGRQPRHLAVGPRSPACLPTPLSGHPKVYLLGPH